MATGATNNKNSEKLGTIADPLSLGELSDQAGKVKRSLMPNKKEGRPSLFVRQKIIKGRPYYYLVWREVDAAGVRKQRTQYLGTTLPKGYRLGRQK